MKKFLIIFFISIFSLILISCGNDDENVIDTPVTEDLGNNSNSGNTNGNPSTNNPNINNPDDNKDNNVDEPTIEVIPDYPHLKPEKDLFKLGEDIPVKLFNTEGCKRVVLTEYGREPSALHDITLKSLSKNPSEVTLTGSRIEKAGDYTIWLCGASQYDYIYTYDIHIDDEDENDYGIESAQLKQVYSFMSNDEYTAGYNRIIVKTNHKTELTYRLYWCKDGQRLSDYMALKTVKTADTDFNIELHEKLFKPKEANQIEIAVVEGVSTSYYLDVSGKLELEESDYEFTFNAISDLHIQSPQDSFLFNDHFKTALKQIYSSDSKGILAVGDIVNFGKESEYEFFKSLYSEVENPNNVGFYPAIGNHEYMYFTDFEEPVGYFKKHFNLDSHYYSFELEGYKFIVLGTDTVSRYGFMKEAQLTWLENELAAVEKGKPVFIALHQPLQNTVDGTLFTLYGQTDYGFIENYNRLINILSKYPNAIMFSGHSHHTLEGEMPVNINTKGPIFVNTGSMGYLNQFFGSECESEIGGSEGLFIEVYKDYILIKGKEFSYNRWVANCQIKIPRIYN